MKGRKGQGDFSAFLFMREMVSMSVFKYLPEKLNVE